MTSASSTHRSKWVKTSARVQLHLREWGDGSQNVVCLLIHGTAEGGYIWDDFAPEFADHCLVAAIDLRGHGDSDHDPTHQYSLLAHVADVRDVLESYRNKKIILVGHSLGADIAVRIAPLLGEKLRGLAIVDSGPEVDLSTPGHLIEILREGYRPYRSITDYVDWLMEHRPFASPAILQCLATQSLNLQSDGTYKLKFDFGVVDMMGSNIDGSWWLPTLRKIRTPTLVVRGQASSVLSRRTAETMLKALTNARLVVVQGAGHAVSTDNPAGFMAGVRPFLLNALHV